MNDSIIREFLYRQELDPLTLAIVLGVSFILGVVHALGPGHGKSLMAAYLVGARGRIRDALVLALTITVSHVISVIAIGFIALLVMDFFWSEKINLWLSILSGLAIFGIGVWLLIKRIMSWTARWKDAKSEVKSSHNHDTGHPHTHSHQGYGPAVSLGSNITLGISSGIVPCPKALVILFLAISLQKTLLGIIIVSVFSLGLASVLVILGILLVRGSHLLKGRLEDRRIQLIPVMGALIIIGLGIFIVIRTSQFL